MESWGFCLRQNSDFFAEIWKKRRKTVCGDGFFLKSNNM